MTRRLFATIAATTIVMGTMTTNANAGTWSRPTGPCNEPAFKITRHMSLSERQHRARRLIVCAFDRFAPGQASTAIAIASRESGLDPFQSNPHATSACRPWSGTVYGACGLFQHLARYWIGRTTYLRPRWFPNTWPHVSPYHARANALVAAKMVGSAGWGPWSTA